MGSGVITLVYNEGNVMVIKDGTFYKEIYNDYFLSTELTDLLSKELPRIPSDD